MKFTLKKILIWIDYTAIGISTTIALVSYTWDSWNLSRWTIIILGFPMALAGAMLAYAGYRFAWLRTAKLPLWLKASLIGLGLLVGFALPYSCCRHRCRQFTHLKSERLEKETR